MDSMKILIVDDQWVILEGLKERVEWKKLGVEEIFLANSVAEARGILAINAIDIVITDIEMPIEDGMVLASWLQKNFPLIPCIFLTAFADFNYAQKAIKYGGFDYILQPAKTEDIERVIQKCIQDIQKKRSIQMLADKGYEYDDMQEKILKNIVKAMYSDSSKLGSVEEDWESEIEKLHIYKWFFPVIIDVKCDQCEIVENRIIKKIGAYNRCIGARVKQIENYVSYGFVICGCEEEWNKEETKLFFQELYMDFILKGELTPNIYVGKMITDGLLEVIHKIKENQENNVLLKGGVYWLKEKKTVLKLKEPNMEVWKKWMLEGDGELIQNQIHNLLEYAENEHQLTIEYMKQLFESFVDVWIVCCYLKKINGRDLFESSQHYEEFRYSFRTMDTFNKSVRLIIENFNEFLKSESKNQEDLDISARIEKVKQYVEENLDKNITRSDAASLTYLSEDYFSKIFKSETGYGFKEYILIQKMNYSKKLLEETNFPVGVIAGKVGYDNFSNFSQIFKKFTGKTPQEYRGNQ